MTWLWKAVSVGMVIEDDHVLRRAFDFEVLGQRKMGGGRGLKRKV